MDWTRPNFDHGSWLNPPPDSLVRNDRLEISAAKGSDFWRRTHYGFTRDTGHALLFDMPEAFVAEIDFTAAFSGKYEQAGLLLRLDDGNWIKAGVEFADGRSNWAVVVTRGSSDWSMAPADPDARAFTIRLSTTRDGVILHARSGGGWQILRVADFPTGKRLLGPMACAPETSGLRVAFTDFRVGKAPADPLYLDPADA